MKRLKLNSIFVLFTMATVFVGDAKDHVSNGSLYAFDKNGKLEYTLVTGINPGKITLLNK